MYINFELIKITYKMSKTVWKFFNKTNILYEDLFISLQVNICYFQLFYLYLLYSFIVLVDFFQFIDTLLSLQVSWNLFQYLEVFTIIPSFHPNIPLQPPFLPLAQVFFILRPLWITILLLIIIITTLHLFSSLSSKMTTSFHHCLSVSFPSIFPSSR